ncbi:MAG: hypothetical protein SGILL_008536 [Bacillariaceae sp.]
MQVSRPRSDVPSSRASSREPSRRGRRSSSKERSTDATRSSSVSRRGTRSSSKERRSGTRASSREPSRTSSSRDPSRRASSREPSRRAASRERIASHSAVAEGSSRRRGMKRSDLMQQGEVPHHDKKTEAAIAFLKANEKKEPHSESAKVPERASSPIKPEPTKVMVKSCQDSFDFGGFPSTYSFDNDDPFKSFKTANSPPPLTKKPSKTSESVTSRKSSLTTATKKDDDTASIPSMFAAAMDYGKKTKKKASKASSKSKKSSSENDPAKSKKKKKTKTSDPETPATTKTKKTKKSTKKSKIKKEEAPKNDNGFDWEVPVTPVFETPSKAPKKKLSSKEDINELCKRDKDTTDAFHNSLDNLFELPAGLMSPVAKVTVSEKDQPVIEIPDDMSHASDMSSICSLSERDDDLDDETEPETPKTQRRTMSGDRSLRSHRTSVSRETTNTRGTRNSAATSATAWQLREQQKHARRAGGRRAMSMQTPQTAPSRPRRAMTTHLKHQQCPLPPAFAGLSAPSTPKTPAMNRRLMSSKERGLQDRLSKDRKGSIAGSLLYFSGDNDEASIEPDLLSTCSRSVYSQRNEKLKKFNKPPSTSKQQIAIPQNAKLEVDPVTGKQQLVVELGDVPAAFKTSMRSLQSSRSRNSRR